jgi:hypothetical protein
MFDNDNAFELPSATDALPEIPPEYVNEIVELVREPLPMLLNVLSAPLIVLLVRT